MRISIRQGAGARRKGVRAHVERRLDFALSGFHERIGSVTVRLSHDEPARGGGAAMKRCEIEVRLRPRSVGVQDTDADLLVAVDNATRRLQRSLTRALESDSVASPDQPRPAGRGRPRR
ncbi:MAG TPA: HPF/RaiA family ribosome-associated protein [Polyangia bacterium]|nr:HPF/RaiA family ribosome-associated protein [Polyangia bacterium]